MVIHHYIKNNILLLIVIIFLISEPTETERLYCYARANRKYGQRFLAHDMARKRVLHRNVNQDF